MSMKQYKGLLFISITVSAAVLAAVGVSQFKPENLKRYEVVNFSGKAEIYDVGKRRWHPAARGEAVGEYDQIRTGEGSDIDLKMREDGWLRLEENSHLKGKKFSLFDTSGEGAEAAELKQGRLLAYYLPKAEDPRFEVTSPHIFASAKPGSLFLFEVESEADAGEPRSWVGVLRGEVEVHSLLLLKDSVYAVQPLEKTQAQRGTPLVAPVRVSRSEWNQLKEAYELAERAAPQAKEQLDLSKKAGNLFDFVFDHGTFYTPKFGYASREFMWDEDRGTVSMQLEYDVFPTGSFVGIYLKLRELDLSKYETLSYKVRSVRDAGAPDEFKIELKNNSGVMRGYAFKEFQSKWRTITIPLNFTKEAKVEELAFVFANNRVGEHKKGMLEFADFVLKEKPAAEALS